MAKPLAFVVMPFSATKTCNEREWTSVFETIFRPTMEELGFECERAQPTSGSVIGRIVEKLRSAHVVLADVTDRNANVFYELGVRHALRRGTIIVSQDDAHVPSDLTGYWYVRYGTRSWDLSDFRAKIAVAVAEINSPSGKSDSPVGDYLGAERLGVSTLLQKETLKKLLALRTELTGNLIELQSEHSDRPRFFQDECLALLLTTLYVDPGPEFLRRAYEFRWRTRVIAGPFAVDDRLMSISAEDGTWLLREVEGLLKKFQDGSFTEPITISAMVWSPGAASGLSATSVAGLHVASVRSLQYKRLFYDSVWGAEPPDLMACRPVTGPTVTSVAAENDSAEPSHEDPDSGET